MRTLFFLFFGMLNGIYLYVSGYGMTIAFVGFLVISWAMMQTHNYLNDKYAKK